MQMMANALMTVSMVINSGKGLWETWTQSEEEVSFGEKLLNTFNTLASVLPMTIFLFND
jgi:hypothetical protein